MTNALDWINKTAIGMFPPEIKKGAPEEPPQVRSCECKNRRARCVLRNCKNCKTFDPVFNRMGAPNNIGNRQLIDSIQGTIRRTTGKQYPDFFKDLDKLSSLALTQLNQLIRDMEYDINRYKRDSKNSMMGLRFGAIEPVTYNEYLIAFMGADPLVRNTDRSERVEDKPFEYIVDVWRSGGPRVKELRDGISNLGTQWLKWLIDNDTSLDENDREDYNREPMRYFGDSFNGVRMFNVGRTESAFWKKPGYKELWLISMSLAIQRVLDEQSEAFGQSTFLNVKLIDKDRLENATGEW